MKNNTCKNNWISKQRKAFTLVELLIVIAIIGILFIVLVSKVDFATDKAKATGVQTDFRSFQLAFDTVAKENAGFNTFGWDTGDANQDGIRNSYDEGDTNKDGIQNGTEVFTGHKVYAETFTKVYSLKKNGTGSYDRDALNRLETAINANLDPKLHITIKDDGEIVMANGAKDPWNKEYHGWYITNAEVDKKDRGAIIMYSDGANNEFGSEHTIANGIVSISIPGSNKAGKDDYSIVSVYTYVNGYGEVKNVTSGFSNNQNIIVNNNVNPDNNGGSNESGSDNGSNNNVDVDFSTIEPGLYLAGTNYQTMTMSWDEIVANGYLTVLEDGRLSNNQKWYNEPCAGTDYLVGDLVLPNDGSITSLGNDSSQSAFGCCYYLTSVVLPDSITTINMCAFYNCRNLLNIKFGNNVTTFKSSAFNSCVNMTQFIIPETVTTIENNAFWFCLNLVEVINLSQTTTNVPTYKPGLPGSNQGPFNLVTSISESKLITENGLQWMRDNEGVMWLVNDLTGNNNVVLPNDYHGEPYKIAACTYTYSTLESVVLGEKVIALGNQVFDWSENLRYIELSANIVSMESGAADPGCDLQKIIIYNVEGFRNTENKMHDNWYNVVVDNIEFKGNDAYFYTNLFATSSTIKSITMHAVIPPEFVGTRVINGLEAIYVPAESVDIYKNTAGWSNYADLIQQMS